MGEQELATTVQAMMQAGKGLLAMDESNSTCNQRFAKLGDSASGGGPPGLAGIV